MGNNLLTPQQLQSYVKPSSPATPTTPNNGALLTPQQLQSYASQKATSSNNSNPASSVGSSWDAFDKATKPAPSTTPKINLEGTPIASYGTGPSNVSKMGSNIVSGVANDYKNTIPNFLNAASSGKHVAGEVDPLSGKPISQGAATVQNVGEGALRATASGLGTVFSPIARTIQETITNNPTVQKLVSGDGILGKTLDLVNQAHTAYTNWADQNPEKAQNLESAFAVGTAAIGEKPATDIAKTSADIAVKAGTEVKNVADDVTTLAKNKIQSMVPETKAPVLNEKTIVDSYNKSIKPSITGKNTAGQVAQANTRTVSGLKSIADNKANLQFTDAEGNVVKGQTPQTVEQLSQAIGQTKASLYKQYNALAVQAGEKGIAVDPVNIGTELSNVINNKALKISNPDAISYAQGLQERLISGGPIDAETAQQVIQNFNDELKTFYRNPTPGMASRVQIDAMVANRMRAQLDDGITNATGEQYQTLKNQYGALASMEKDVAKSAARVAKQSQVGLATNISNIASGAELIRGLMTMNPTDIAVSLGIKGIQKYIKYLNDPNVGVSKIFSEIEKSSPSSTGSTPGSGVINKVEKPSPEPTTFTPKSQTGKLIQEAKKSGTQKGSITIGSKTFKAIPDATKAELVQAIDYLRIGKSSKGIDNTVSRLAQKYNISEDLSNTAIANKFQDLIEKTKTL